jgi:hypothetical protein
LQIDLRGATASNVCKTDKTNCSSIPNSDYAKVSSICSNFS